MMSSSEKLVHDAVREVGIPFKTIGIGGTYAQGLAVEKAIEKITLSADLLCEAYEALACAGFSRQHSKEIIGELAAEIAVIFSEE